MLPTTQKKTRPELREKRLKDQLNFRERERAKRFQTGIGPRQNKTGKGVGGGGGGEDRSKISP